MKVMSLFARINAPGKLQTASGEGSSRLMPGVLDKVIKGRL